MSTGVADQLFSVLAGGGSGKDHQPLVSSRDRIFGRHLARVWTDAPQDWLQLVRLLLWF